MLERFKFAVNRARQEKLTKPFGGPRNKKKSCELRRPAPDGFIHNRKAICGTICNL